MLPPSTQVLLSNVGTYGWLEDNYVTCLRDCLCTCLDALRVPRVAAWSFLLFSSRFILNLNDDFEQTPS